MSVYKPAKSRFFQYDFQYQGRRFHGSTGQETRRAAEAVERRKRQAAALGELDVDDIPTLQQAASAWWTDRAQHLRTADDVWTRIKICLRLVGERTRVSEIDSGVVLRAIQRRARETYARSTAEKARRYPVQPATVNADIIATLRRILRHAAKGDPRIKSLMPAIAWDELRLPEPEGALRIYTAPQRAAWRAACDPTAAIALDLLLTYGMRFSELFFAPSAFHPAEDDEGGFAFLLLEHRKRGLMVLPLRDDDARAIAARVGRAIAAGLPSIWLEQDARGRLVAVGYHGLYARLRSAAKRAGLTADMNRVIHGARHHAGSTIVQRTGNLKTAQQLLGHANIASTMRYAHMLGADLKAALESTPREPAGDAGFEPPKQPRARKRS